MFHRLKSLLKRNHKTDYEYWREGEKQLKMPWVIKYYGSITNLEQYKMGLKVKNRAVASVGFVCFIAGVYIGYTW